ncbi:hypothetical protein JBP901_gp031 [Bacillus phage JBP901]|uniref:Uncharacterized protein n=1 Tax=Bacillus phage JBP901 TaxID=1498212 RepID=A0A0E3DEV2_9CAUD|nr:hypothetical protein JBP901_gp031 [Bacillus phage JBP901]AID17744.1 hypothetical protein JBP901_gp031 [Bacillus phage JBP901]
MTYFIEKKYSHGYLYEGECKTTKEVATIIKHSPAKTNMALRDARRDWIYINEYRVKRLG